MREKPFTKLVDQYIHICIYIYIYIYIHIIIYICIYLGGSIVARNKPRRVLWGEPSIDTFDPPELRGLNIGKSLPCHLCFWLLIYNLYVHVFFLVGSATTALLKTSVHEDFYPRILGPPNSPAWGSIPRIFSGCFSITFRANWQHGVEEVGYTYIAGILDDNNFRWTSSNHSITIHINQRIFHG